jgi:mannosyltransferase
MAQADKVAARNRLIWWVGLLLILLLAAGLRFFRLDAQSFWNDEGNSARIAERTVKLILEGSAGDIHPPLYYLVLHYWRAVAGESEFALRAFSAVGGVALVALISLLGARWFSVPAGLAAGLLAAINPFQVYYSQEARSYIWVAFLTAAAVHASWRMNGSWIARESGEGPSARAVGWSAAYVLLVAAGLYTHHLFFLILVPINLVVVIGLIGDRSFRLLGRWILLHLLVGVLYLPWAPIAWRQIIGWPAPGGGVPLMQGALDTLRLLGLGSTIETSASGSALLGFGFLVLLGLIPSRSRSQTVALVLAVLWLFVPVSAILIFKLYREAFLKFMLIVSPAFCIVAGRGFTRLWRPGPVSTRTILLPLALSAGLVLSFTYDSLNSMYFDPRYARVDYRQMAREIQAGARPGDAVILNAANQWEVFTYYYTDVDRVYPLPRSRPVNEQSVIAELAEIVARHDRIFAVFWAEAESDPQRVVERWLDAHAYKATDEWWGDVRLVTYAVPAALPATLDVPLAAQFGDRIWLHGYALNSNRLAAGDILQLSLFWEALAPISERYKVFVHVIGNDGRPVAQRDSEPGGGLMLTTTWEAGRTVADHYGVLIPPATPPGRYTLAVGLYPLGDPATRLPITLDGALIDGVLEIETIDLVSQ